METLKSRCRLAFLGACLLAAAWALVAAEISAQGKAAEKHGDNIVFPISKPTREIQHHVLFSHDLHIAKGAACKDCHNGKVFLEEKKMGVNEFTMKDIFRKKACGACHDGATKAKNGKAVFGPTKNCVRCHNVKWREKA